MPLKIGLKGLLEGISIPGHEGAIVGDSWMLLHIDILAASLDKGGH